MAGWATGVVFITPGIVAYANILAAVQATLPVSSVLSANAVGGASVRAVLSTQIPLSAIPHGEAFATASLVRGGSGWAVGTVFITPGMVSYASEASTVVANLVSSFVALTANAASTSNVSAQLTTAGVLNATPVALSLMTAALTSGISLAAVPVIAASVSAAIQGSAGVLTAAAVATVSAAGSLTTRIVLQSSAASNALVGASLNTGSLLSSIGSASSIVVAPLTTGIPLSSAATSQSSSSASLSTLGIIRSQAQVTSLASAALNSAILCASAASGGTSCIASLTTAIPVSAICNGEAFSAGDLSAPGTAVGLYSLDPDWVVAGRRTQWTQRLGELAPGEEVVLAFAFGDDLQNGEQLLGRVTVNVSVSAGTDPNAAQSLSGPASFDSSQTMVLQPITGQVAGCDYYFEVTAPTTNPRKVLSRFGLLPVRS